MPARRRSNTTMRLRPSTLKACALALAAIAAALAAAAPAGAEMRSTKLSPRLCETIGGGRFVPIPWEPTEEIDRRLLRDLRWMRRKYDIYVTDGYSMDPVHALNGEHPLGLAADVVPDRSRGGTWREITALADWAEPVQDQPRLPFRWVGYDGDPGHGRGNHLHLSWAHSPSDPGDPARTVYTRLCPSDPTDSTTTTKHGRRTSGSGGTSAGDGGGTGSGGVPAGKLSLAPVVEDY